MGAVLKSGKPLTVFGLAMINVIAIDSLRNLPVAAKLGSHVIFFYLVGALFFLLPCVLVTAELATRFPKTGGSYIWVRNAFGEKWGFVTAWLLWVYNVVWFPTILVFIAENILYLFGWGGVASQGEMTLVVLLIFVLATFLNAKGMQVSAWLSIVGAILGTILPMVILIGLGGFWLYHGHVALVHLHSAHPWVPQLTNGHGWALFVVVLFSLVGIEMSAVHAGDVRNPRKDFPRALYISVTIILASMIFASMAIGAVVPASKLNIISGIDQALQTLLMIFHIKWLMPVVVLMIVVGAFAGMAAWVLGPAKALMVAAQDGCAPKWFGRFNKKGAPSGSLWLQCGVVVLLSFLYLLFPSFKGAYWFLSDLTGQLALIYYLILFVAAMKLCWKKKTKAVDSYRIPFGNAGVVLVCGIGVLSCLAVIFFGFLPSGESVMSGSWFDVLLVVSLVFVVALPWFLASKQPVLQKKQKS